jgi:hypothetical protein
MERILKTSNTLNLKGGGVTWFNKFLINLILLPRSYLLAQREEPRAKRITKPLG